MNREKKLLIWLLGMLCLAGLYAWWAAPMQQRVAKPGDKPVSTPGSRPSATGGDSSKATSLHLERLARADDGFGRIERDIFSFKVVAPPPPRIVKPVPPPPPVQQSVPVQPVPPVVAGPVAARFDFLGSLEKEGRQLVFLASGQNIYLVAEGQRFGSRDEFLLKSVGTQNLRIEQQGLAQPITVPTAESDARDRSRSVPGIGLPTAAPVTPSQPLQRYNQALPRTRNYNPNRGTP